MTSKLLSNLSSSQINLSSSLINNSVIPIYKNIFLSNKDINISSEDINTQKEKQKNIEQKSFQNNNSIFINNPKIISYDDMLKKNIRTFNILKNSEKIENIILNDVKEKYNLDFVIEIIFKFTCDYELIENEIKSFFELFGDINSLDYDMNSNSVKIKYKYYFSIMNINNYLNHLLYEIKNEKDKNNDKKENIMIKKIMNERKTDDDIDKFITFLTVNYKNYIKNKSCEKNNKFIDKNIKLKNQFNETNNNETKNNNNNNDMICSYLSKNNNSSSKYLTFQQNTETPIKKTNIIANFSANYINSNINNNKNHYIHYHTLSKSFHPFNLSFKQPLFYLPYAMKKNKSIPISTPILFPFNSPFINKSPYLNNTKKKVDNFQ